MTENGFATGGEKGWGTATGLVKLKGKHGRDVLLSCSHVLRGDNRLYQRSKRNHGYSLLFRQ